METGTVSETGNGLETGSGLETRTLAGSKTKTEAGSETGTGLGSETKTGFEADTATGACWVSGIGRGLKRLEQVQAWVLAQAGAPAQTKAWTLTHA